MMSDKKQPQKANYSYEEMMRRLRNSSGSSSTSEETVVDQASGLVQVKRRRRKRKGTKIGQGEVPRWIRYTRFGFLIGLVALAITALICYKILEAAVRSEQFRIAYGERLGEILAMDEPATVGPASFHKGELHVSSLEGKNAANGFISSFKLQTAEFRLGPSSYLWGNWNVDFLVANNGKIILSNTPARSSEPTEFNSSNGSGGFFLSARPPNVIIREVSIGKVEISIEGSDTPLLKDARLALSRRGNKDAWHFRGTVFGGTIHLPGWPEMQIADLNIALHNDHLEILRGILTYDEQQPGKINVSGVFPYQRGEQAMLELVVEDFPIQPFLSGAWQSMLAGTWSSNKISSSWRSGRAEETWQASGNITSNNLRLGQWPLLQNLENIAHELMVRPMEFQKTELHLDYSTQGALATDLTANTRDGVRLTGGFSIDPDGKHSGNFRLGIPIVRMNRTIPENFTTYPDGIAWTDFMLGGDIDQPIENLSPLIQEQQTPIDVIPDSLPTSVPPQTPPQPPIPQPAQPQPADQDEPITPAAPETSEQQNELDEESMERLFETLTRE